MESATVARGLAGIAALALVFVAGRAILASAPVASSTPVPVCSIPVEEATEREPRLACAADPELAACRGLRPGDRVGPNCRVERGGMSARIRLLAGFPLDLNRATAADLELLEGIGPKRAAAIVRERSRRPFASVDDLVRVSGIGPKTVDRVRPFVVVGAP